MKLIALCLVTTVATEFDFINDDNLIRNGPLKIYPDGSYVFWYLQMYSERQESGKIQNRGNKKILVVTGEYKWWAGRHEYSVYYTADEKGYRSRMEIHSHRSIVLSQAPAPLVASLLG